MNDYTKVEGPYGGPNYIRMLRELNQVSNNIKAQLSSDGFDSEKFANSAGNTFPMLIELLVIVSENKPTADVMSRIKIKVEESGFDFNKWLKEFEVIMPQIKQIIDILLLKD
jgi:hypothetical protein